MSLEQLTEVAATERAICRALLIVAGVLEVSPETMQFVLQRLSRYWADYQKASMKTYTETGEVPPP